VNFEVQLLKITCAAKMLGKADKTIQAQNHNLQPHTGVPLVRLPLCWAWLAIKGDGWSGIACGVQGIVPRMETGVLSSNTEHWPLLASAVQPGCRTQPGLFETGEGLWVCDFLKVVFAP